MIDISCRVVVLSRNARLHLHRPDRLLATTALIGVLSCLGAPPAAYAADYAVTTTNASGFGSLAQAIADADAASGGSIGFDSGLGTITLSGTQHITEDISLGASDSLTVTGSSSPVFSVDSGKTLTVSSSSLSLTGSNGSTGDMGSTGQIGGNGGTGGSAASGTGFTLANVGTLTGGTGGNGGNGGGGGWGGDGGTGGNGGNGGGTVTGSGFTVTNSGQITGGGGGAGGSGGYSGLNGGNGGTGGNGGGTVTGNGFTVTNSGQITGGRGGAGGLGGYDANGGNGGNGGGAVTGSGFTVTNSGQITGGGGGVGGGSDFGGTTGSPGAGGVGIVSSGGSTVINSGTISGGNGADAIDFSGGGNRLELQAGSTIIGNVVSTSGATNGGDTFALGGDVSSPTSFDVSALGNQYTGFTTYEKTGTSTWTLTGTTTATPLWTISAGTLAISSGTTLGTGTLTLDGGTLETTASTTLGQAIMLGNGDGTIKVDTGATLAAADVIAGSGGLTIDGGGTLTLSNTNTYAGATTINSGATLALSGSGSIVASSGVTDNGRLDISATSSGTTVKRLSGTGTVALGDKTLTIADGGSFGGGISGNGGVVVDGGTLTLSGTNSYSGSTTIASGATLKPTSSSAFQQSSNIFNNGTLDLSSINSIRLYSGYTQLNSGTLTIEVASASQYTRLDAANSAWLDGTLNVVVANGNTLAGGDTLSDVITAAGGVFGTFTQVTDTSALFDFVPVYGGSNVSLDVRTSSTTSAVRSVEDTGNTRALGAAQALDQAFAADPSGALSSLFMSQTGERQVSDAVSQTLPLLNGGNAQVTTNTMASVENVISRRQQTSSGASGVSTGSAPHDGAAWIKPFATRTMQNAKDDDPGYEADTVGIVMGVDVAIGDAARAGLAFAYATTNADSRSSVAPQGVETQLYELVGYGSYNFTEGTTATYRAALGVARNQGARTIDFSTSGRAESDFDSVIAGIGGGVEHRFAVTPRVGVSPYFNADYNWVRNDGYRETSSTAGLAPLLLSVDEQTSQSLVPELGMRFDFRASPAWKLSAHAGEGYELLDRKSSLTARYAGFPGVDFTTEGAEENAWITRAGIAATYIRDDLSLQAGYDVEARNGYTNQTVEAVLKMAF